MTARGEGTVARALFGRLEGGTEVERITLRRGSVTARVITYGAALQSLEVPDRTGAPDDIVLGHDDLAGYVAHRMFFGATVGRVANRIAGGRFTLDGRAFDLATNEGTTTLHGGPDAFDRRVWTVLAADDTPSVTLGSVSPDGDQGFPGRLTVTVRYAIEARAGRWALTIRHEAETDAPTPISLTNHSYFALPGSRALAGRPASALDVSLTVDAARYLPVDAAMIPHAPAPVVGTPFDFRGGRTPRTAVAAGHLTGYDHCLCLDSGGFELSDPVSGRRILFETDQPGLQVYTGNFLDGRVRGKADRAYAAHDAICLEAQAWPNAVNMDPALGAPNTILRPGDRYLSMLEMAFDTFPA